MASVRDPPPETTAVVQDPPSHTMANVQDPPPHTMANVQDSDPPATANLHIPPWEATHPAPRSALHGLFAPSAKESASTTDPPSNPPTLRSRLDAILPPHKRYLGRSRRTFLLALLILTLGLLALILGLAIGLSLKKSSSSSAALPLPSNTDTFTGDLTYYSPALGSCGVTSSETDLICAVSHTLYDAASTSSNPNNNPLCGRRIRVVRYDSLLGANRSVDVSVVDRCVGCQVTDLDLSPAAFDKLADEALGRVVGSWAWLQ